MALYITIKYEINYLSVVSHLLAILRSNTPLKVLVFIEPGINGNVPVFRPIIPFPILSSGNAISWIEGQYKYQLVKNLILVGFLFFLCPECSNFWYTSRNRDNMLINQMLGDISFCFKFIFNNRSIVTISINSGNDYHTGWLTA